MNKDRILGGMLLAGLLALIVYSVIVSPPPQVQANQGTQTAPNAEQEATSNAGKPFELFIGAQISSTTNTEKNSSEQAAKNAEKSQYWFMFFQTAAGCLVAVFTVVLAVVAFFQWKTVEEQAKIFREQVKAAEGQIEEMKKARESSERQVRADITIVKNDIEVKNIGINKFIFRVYTVFKNTGQTPAYNVTATSVVCVMGFPIAPTFNFPLPIQHEPSRMILGLEQPMTIGADSEEKFTREQIDIINNSNEARRVYVYGKIEFIDTFRRQPRHITYCDSFKWMSEQGGYRATPCSRGHGTEEQPHS